MCGRFVVPEEAAILACWPEICQGQGSSWTAGFNIAPTRVIPILIPASNGGLELLPVRWGLIPGWWQKATLPTLSFNARCEDAARKPLWRDSLRTRRCLVPARGWYEWHRTERIAGPSGRQSPQPYYLFRPNQTVIAFAGLWSEWQRPGVAPVFSCALLTKPAAPGIVSIHPRMPVVLQPEIQPDWLNPATSADTVQSLIIDSDATIQAHPVSPQVNDARQDGPHLIHAIEPPPPDLDLFGNPSP
ncbi:MAG: SOS response-associated peptidase [Kiritimatiellae bacterium]|nr:SOS response-associated peptidase [Kiritimatiellia bacterium]MDD4342462.1 SOS response-associated peptidase [Kiritimatiellia bacterium]